MKKSINKLATLFAVAVLCICSLAVALPATSALAAEKDVSRMAELGNIKAAEFFVENDVCYQNYDLGYTRTQNGETRIVFGRNAVLAQDGVQTVLVDLLSVAKSEYYTSRPGELDSTGERYFIPYDRTVEQMQHAFSQKYREVLESGYNVGIPRSGVKVWEGMAIQDFKYGDSVCNTWDSNISFIMYNGMDDKCYFVTDTVAKGVINEYRALAPVSDAVVVGDKVYQNFTNGYFVGNANSEDAAAFVPFKNYDVAQEKEITPSGNLGGYVGTVDMEYGSLEERTVLGQSFVDRYNDLVGEGVHPGFAATFVVSKNGIMVQYFVEGDSTASGISVDGIQLTGKVKMLNGALLLARDSISEEIFAVKDVILETYNSGNNMTDLGAPISDAFAVTAEQTEHAVQNFQQGYIIAAGTHTEVVRGKNMDSNGSEYEISTEGQVAKLSSSVQLPSGVSKADIEEKFKAAYDAIEGYGNPVPQGLIKYAYQFGVRTMLQVYEANEKYIALAYDEQNNQVRFLNEYVYAAFKVTPSLGAPIGELTQVEPKLQRMNFTEGYVDVAEVIEYDENFQQQTGYQYTTHLGYTYENGAFVPKAYTDNVGKIGSKAGRHPIDNVNLQYASYNITAQKIETAFKKAYTDSFNAGFHPGVPDDEYVLWWPTGSNGIIKQSFLGGDGDGKAWGRSLMIVYNPIDEQAYIVTGKILSLYSADGASGNGYPLSNMQVASDGTIIQNFQREDGIWHYIVAPNSVIAEHQFGELTLEQYEASLGGNGSQGGNEGGKNEKGCGCGSMSGADCVWVALPVLGLVGAMVIIVGAMVIRKKKAGKKEQKAGKKEQKAGKKEQKAGKKEQ